MRGFNNLIHFVNCVNIAELTGVPTGTRLVYRSLGRVPDIIASVWDTNRCFQSLNKNWHVSSVILFDWPTMGEGAIIFAAVYRLIVPLSSAKPCAAILHR